MKLRRFLIILLCLPLAGCSLSGVPEWNIFQVSDRMFVELMGIEEENGVCFLSAQVSDIAEADAGEPTFRVYAGEGHTFTEACDDIESETGRKLFFGHCRTVICDSDILFSKDALDSLIKAGVPIGSRIYYSDKPAENTSDTDENVRADIFALSSRRSELNGTAVPVTLMQAFTASAEERRMMVPRVSRSLCGAAVTDPGKNRIAVLTMAESAAVNMLTGYSGVKLTVPTDSRAGVITVKKLSPSVYISTVGEKPVCTVSFELWYSPSEMPCGMNEEAFGEYAAEASEKAVESICRISYHNGYAENVVGKKNADILSSFGENVDFRAYCIRADRI